MMRYEPNLLFLAQLITRRTVEITVRAHAELISGMNKPQFSIQNINHILGTNSVTIALLMQLQLLWNIAFVSQERIMWIPGPYKYPD